MLGQSYHALITKGDLRSTESVRISTELPALIRPSKTRAGCPISQKLNRRQRRCPNRVQHHFMLFGGVHREVPNPEVIRLQWSVASTCPEVQFLRPFCSQLIGIQGSRIHRKQGRRTISFLLYQTTKRRVFQSRIERSRPLRKSLAKRIQTDRLVLRNCFLQNVNRQDIGSLRCHVLCGKLSYSRECVERSDALRLLKTSPVPARKRPPPTNRRCSGIPFGWTTWPRRPSSNPVGNGALTTPRPP